MHIEIWGEGRALPDNRILKKWRRNFTDWKRRFGECRGLSRWSRIVNVALLVGPFFDGLGKATVLYTF
jgi:hypothetical protein